MLFRSIKMAKIINSQEFDNTIESGVVVVDFFATWCGPCKMLSPVIDELSGELENVNFVKVDIDQSMDLAQKFKIVSVPTLKVFKNGEEVDTLMGFMPKEVLKSKVEAHI